MQHFMKRVILAVLLLAAVFVSADEADPCSLRKDVPCLHVPNCTNGSAKIDRYWLTTASYPLKLASRQHMTTELCHDTQGVVVKEQSSDLYIQSPWANCNDPVWKQSSVVEMFIYPTGNVYDVPQFYYEIDVTPTEAVFASLIYNDKGNVTNCEGCAKQSIELPCTGKNTFPDHQITHKVEVTENTYTTQRYIPFAIFPEKLRQNRVWRANFYRYSYPDGFARKYELSGWSPTYSPSFHEPKRFGILVFDF